MKLTFEETHILTCTSPVFPVYTAIEICTRPISQKFLFALVVNREYHLSSAILSMYRQLSGRPSTVRHYSALTVAERPEAGPPSAFGRPRFLNRSYLHRTLYSEYS